MPAPIQQMDLHGKKVADAEAIFLDHLNRARIQSKLIEFMFITGVGKLQNRLIALAKEHDVHYYIPMSNRGCIIVEFE